MSFEVTATRRRPKTFDELTGQEFVVTTLRKSIEAGRIAHAYLFSGPRGVGKTSSARLLAKALNCVNGPTPTPCNVCAQCTEIAKGSALDVIEIDGASNTSVNDVREIKDEVLFAPTTSKYKVYIIDEVHMLSNSAFNALLKTIEEPPPYVVFIFATTEIHKVPATIKSRCQQFNFRLIHPEVIQGLLKATCAELQVQADDEALYWIAKEATGSLRDAYTLYDQVVAFSDGHITLEKIRSKLGLVGLDQMNAIVSQLAEGATQGLLEAADAILASGVSAEQFLSDLTEYFRSLLLIRQGIHREALLGASVDRYPAALREAFTPAQLEKALETLLELYRKLRYSLNPRYELELTLARLAGLKHYLSAAEVLEKVRDIKAGLFSGDEGKKKALSL